MACLLWMAPSWAGLELFGKAAYSKSNISDVKYTQNISGAAGLAITLIPQLRLEGRYTVQNQYQNRLELNSLYTLTNFKTQTTIYSAGLDISLFDARSTFQPFIYLGGGYVEVTRAYDITDLTQGVTEHDTEPMRTGIAGQVGLGFRWKVGRSAALEIEAFGYMIDPHKPGALLDIYGTAGLRFFL